MRFVKILQSSLIVPVVSVCLFMIMLGGMVYDLYLHPKQEDLEELTKDWKSYTNETFGFQAKWPSEWKSGGIFLQPVYSPESNTKEDVNPTTFFLQGPFGGEVYTLHIYDARPYSSLKDWAEQVYDPHHTWRWERDSHPLGGAKDGIAPVEAIGDPNDFLFPSNFFRSSTGYAIGFKPTQDSNILTNFYKDDATELIIWKALLENLRTLDEDEGMQPK